MSAKAPLRVVVLGDDPALMEKLSDVPGITVTVIDALDSQFLVHRGPWALVKDQEAFRPFRPLANVTRIHNLVESVSFSDQLVHLTNEAVGYDVLVCATGLAPPAVFRFGNRQTAPSSRRDLTTSTDSFKESVFSASEVAHRMRKSRKVLAAAPAIVVAGGDLQAVEQACAVREAFGQAKKVLLATRESRLMADVLSEADSARLAARLEALSIAVLLGGDAEAAVAAEAAAGGAALLDYTASHAPLSGYLPAAAVNAAGFVECDDKLRVTAASSGTVFAVGRLVRGQTSDASLALHAKVVARNIAALASGKAPAAELGKTAPPLIKLRKGVAVALGSKEYFSVGLAGKLESVKRRRSPRDV